MRVAISSDGAVVAAATERRVLLFDAADGRRLHDLGAESARMRGLAFSPDGRMLATGGSDPTPRLWDVSSGRLLATLVGHGAKAEAVAFRPDGTRVASAGTDAKLRIWDVVSGREVLAIDGDAAHYAVAFSGDGLRLATGGAQNPRAVVRVWPAMRWHADAYPTNPPAARDAGIESAKRAYWRGQRNAARRAATRPTTVPISALFAARREGTT